jgi:SnoaL-like domain
VSDQITQRELHELLQRERVVALMNRYLATVDEPSSFDAEWARSLFSDDVRVEHRGFVLEGIDDIAAGHALVRGGWERTLHFTTNPRVELNGDRAHVNARLFAIHVHRGPNPPDPYIIANVFDADAVRTTDGWRFQGFHHRTVWSCGRSHLDIGTSES